MSQFYYSSEAVSVIQWQEYRAISEYIIWKSFISHVKLNYYSFVECSDDPNEPCISSGQGVLDKYGFSSDNYLMDLIGLIAIFTVGHLAGYLAILYRSRKEPVY